MKLVLSVCCFLLIGRAINVNAQIRVLWSGGITNVSFGPEHSNAGPWRGYRATAAAVDGFGNTLVAGITTLSSELNRYAAFVARINAHGAKSWEYFVGSNASEGPDALEADRQGNVLLTVRLSASEPRRLALIKLSPAGKELWRAADSHVVWGPYPASAIKADYIGNAYLLTFLADGSSQPRLYLTKFNSAGKMLWRSALPQHHYVLTIGGVSKYLCLLPDGSSVVSGFYYSPAEGSSSRRVGFAAKFDLRGRLAWWRDDQEILSDPPRGRTMSKLPYFTSVLGGRYGTICAAAPRQGFMVFSSRGKVLARGNTKGNLGGEVIGATPRGGFILAHSGGYVAELDAVGHILWQGPSRFGLAGVVENRNGWLAAGSGGMGEREMTLSQFNLLGQKLWTVNLLEHFDARGIRNAFHRAPDGTFRVVHDLDWRSEYYPGVAVTALALEPLSASKASEME